MSEALGLLCPSCRVNLVMSERQGIEIDYCPQCRGVWLDRGELDKIIERSEGPAAPPPSRPSAPQPQYREQRYDDDRHYAKPYKKKSYAKSFLSDLFD